MRLKIDKKPDMQYISRFVCVCVFTILSTASIVSLSAHTTVKPDYNAILHQLGEYFKGRDLHTRQLVPVAGDSDVARDDILHELGEYWKGRIAALSALLSQHSTQQHINLFSQLLNNLK